MRTDSPTDLNSLFRRTELFISWPAVLTGAHVNRPDQQRIGDNPVNHPLQEPQPERATALPPAGQRFAVKSFHGLQFRRSTHNRGLSTRNSVLSTQPSILGIR